jgi:hypothetical protein
VVGDVIDPWLATPSGLARVAAVDGEHRLLHELPHLAAALVHPGPQGVGGADLHVVQTSHR